MKKKVFQTCETTLLALGMLVAVVLIIDCLGSIRIAIDDIAMGIYKNNIMVLGLSIGNLFYVVSCSFTLIAAFGYIVTMPSAKSIKDNSNK